MYSTCLFCHGDLGRNESIEHFPVGRRLAFDGAKGRLWVVCRKCERWNLSPLEERWEAIEEAERAFRGTKLRVSTDHIGLAKLKEGLELVRIGEPQRPEMAAWRYGDQFGRRRRKRIALVGGATVLVGGVLIAGPMVGLASGGFFNAIQLLNSGNSLYRAKKRISVPIPGGVHRMRLVDIKSVKLNALGSDVELEVPIRRGITFLSAAMNEDKYIRLYGEDAVRAASAILPRLNQSGGNAGEVTRAVEYLEETANPVKLFHRAAKAIEDRNRGRFMWSDNRASLKTLPTAGRLALEMATHEEAERRALEGELHILEEAWKEAEEIAAISDDLLLPESVESRFERLKRDGDEPSR